MHESILRDYFIGLIDERALIEDLQEMVVQTSSNVFTYQITDMDTEFEVTTQHLLKLCDAVLLGQLEANHLQKIGFCIIASDFFTWDSDSEPESPEAKTVHEWSSPEINFPLTIENIRKFRERLLTGKDTFTIADTR
jgi:hypothetical protein